MSAGPPIYHNLGAAFPASTWSRQASSTTGTTSSGTATWVSTWSS